MKKKISVFALLLSLLLAVLVPAAAPVPVKAANSTETTADDVKYRDIETFMHGMGYTSFSKKDNCKYFVTMNLAYTSFSVYEINVTDSENPYWAFKKNSSVLCFFADVAITSAKVTQYSYYVPLEASSRDCFDCIGSVNVTSGSPETYKGVSREYKCIPGVVLNEIAFSDLNIYDASQYSSTGNYIYDVSLLMYEATVYDSFSFPVWCEYAGLNCLASTNESPTKIPYSYNSYWHIVRKTSSGKWLLTTVGNSVSQENSSDYTFVYSEDMSTLKVLNLYSGEDTNGYLLNVRQYEYDTDGWKVRTYETYDARETEDNYIDLGVGSGVDDTRIIAYTSTDIYDEGFNLITPASTEYYEVTDTPTVTPEPTPGSGSSGSGDSDDTGSDDSGSSGGGRPGSGTRPAVGGEASGGGGLDFIINLFTLIWTKICAVPMAVDGYSISLQQLFVYGALVSIVGGFIMKFIFRR